MRERVGKWSLWKERGEEGCLPLRERGRERGGGGRG